MKALTSELPLKKKLTKKKKPDYSIDTHNITQLTVKLHIKNHIIAIDIPKGITFNQLKINLKKKVFEKTKNKVIGFENIDKNYSLDYQMQMGYGTIENNLEVSCVFEASGKEGI